MENQKNHLSDIPFLTEGAKLKYTWDLHPTKPMIMVIYNYGQPIMTIFLGEAMEAAGYKEVMKHVKECDNTPWLQRWQVERSEELVEILTKDY